jgi:tetratricopeptide (TPR) repeat protein
MNDLQLEERQRIRRQLVERAIELAMRNAWEEAAETNRRIVESFEPDVEAWNRLGKAYGELGRIAEARDAYNKALSIDATNAIAQRNVQRLSLIKTNGQAPARDHHDSVDARFFIEETGKTIARSIFTSISPEDLANLSAGDHLSLIPRGELIAVTTANGLELGMLDGKLSGRLIELLAGGNQYAAAVVRVEGRYVRVMIRETYQAPQLTGRVSFPPETSSGFKAYIKDTLIRHDRAAEEDEDVDVLAYDTEGEDLLDNEDTDVFVDDVNE